MKDKIIPSESENPLVTSDHEAINANFENEVGLKKAIVFFFFIFK
mgnify:CR=1 FL=1